MVQSEAPPLYPNRSSGKKGNYFYDQKRNYSKFGPQRSTEVVEVSKDVVASNTQYTPAFIPTNMFGSTKRRNRVMPKPDLSGAMDNNSVMVKLASDNFKQNINISPTRVLNNPQVLNSEVSKTYAQMSGGRTLNINSNYRSVMPVRILAENVGGNVQRDTAQEAASGSVVIEGGNVQRDTAQEAASGSVVIEGASPVMDQTQQGTSLLIAGNSNNTLQENSSVVRNDGESGSREVTSNVNVAQNDVGSESREGFQANSFSKEFSQEAWVQYAGLIQDHLFKIESFIRAKAQTLSQTLLVKMSNGGSPGGSPSAFAASISGSISARTWKDANGRTFNLIPGKDFTVQAQIIPGIAELHVTSKEHMEWLVGQYRFPYLKLAINAEGQVVQHGQAGTFFITQLRAPLQLYDIWGVDAEHFNEFDNPLKNLIQELCPGVGFKVVNVRTNVPAYDAVSEEWVTVPTLSNKRVTIEVPPGSDFVLPDGPYLLNIEGVGERVVYSQQVKAIPGCQHCGKHCFRDGCKERCKHCGLPFTEEHIEFTCKHKDKDRSFAKSNLWIEKTTKQAIKLHANLISYTQSSDEKISTLHQRLDAESVGQAVLDTQARIMKTAMLPYEMRGQYDGLCASSEDAEFNREFLLPREGSDGRRLWSKKKQDRENRRNNSRPTSRLNDNPLPDAADEEQALRDGLQAISAESSTPESLEQDSSATMEEHHSSDESEVLSGSALSTPEHPEVRSAEDQAQESDTEETHTIADDVTGVSTAERGASNNCTQEPDIQESVSETQRLADEAAGVTPEERRDFEQQRRQQSHGVNSSEEGGIDDACNVPLPSDNVGEEQSDKDILTLHSEVGKCSFRVVLSDAAWASDPSDVDNSLNVGPSASDGGQPKKKVKSKKRNQSKSKGIAIKRKERNKSDSDFTNEMSQERKDLIKNNIDLLAAPTQVDESIQSENEGYISPYSNAEAQASLALQQLNSIELKGKPSIEEPMEDDTTYN